MIQKVGPYFEKLAPPFDWKDNLQELHAHVLSYLLWRRTTLFNQEGGSAPFPPPHKAAVSS